MKRFAFTVSLSLVVFAVTAVIIRTHVRQQLPTVPYLGTNGWTLKRNVTLTLGGGDSRIVGREILYFAADGRRQHTTYRVGDDGTEICENVSVCIPGRGVFLEDLRNQKLVYTADYGGFGGPVDVNAARKGPDYVRDQQVLGYNCAFKRTVLSGGTVEDSYDGYNFSLFPLKMVSQNSERVQTWEPTSIEIGIVPESALVYHAEWPVDFSLFEEKIRRMQSANPSDPRYMQQAERMRQQVEQAKRRLGGQ